MPDLTTRTARRRLPPSPERRWSRLARGRALGYRRPDAAEAGTWYVRLRTAEQRRADPYRKAALGTADDLAEANGETIFNYRHAVELALVWRPDAEAASREPLTVKEAVASYLAWYSRHRRALDRVRNIFEAHILPELGELEIAALTPRRLRRWHEALAEKPARLRGGQAREAVTENQKRARRVTANHVLTALKACLNRAVADELVEGPGAWSKVRGFRGVEVARERYLEPGEIERLLNVCPPDLREMLTAAIHTGCRYGELAALDVRDYMADVGAVHVRQSKSGEARKVFLSEDGAAFFHELVAGRVSGPALRKADGSGWGRNHQSRPMREACAAAGIEPLGVHALRHSYASLYLMSGGSLPALARQLGHRDTRMVEKHYGHLADVWRSNEAREHAPRIGRGERSNLSRFRRPRSRS